MNEHVKELLPRVRKIILEERAGLIETYDGLKHPESFGLSLLTWKLGPVWLRYSPFPRRYTSGGLKDIRGHAQACLSILAREGLMFGRNKPEPGVPHHKHGNRDKRFRFRVSPEQAKKMLSRMPKMT